MKKIRYTRCDIGQEPQKVKSDLVTFLYDIPYLSVCGVLPPLHLLNERLMSGGLLPDPKSGEPGAAWEPFALSAKQYDALWRAIEAADMLEIRKKARYAHTVFKRDEKLEHIADLPTWLSEVAKHRNCC